MILEDSFGILLGLLDVLRILLGFLRTLLGCFKNSFGILLIFFLD